MSQGVSSLKWPRAFPDSSIARAGKTVRTAGAAVSYYKEAALPLAAETIPGNAQETLSGLASA